jgi:hypothetical protein
VEANGHGGDDLDEALLFAFFRAEMPRSWPPPQLPAPAPTALAPARHPWFRSPRFALAASVALLLGGSAVLSGTLTPPPAPDTIPLKDATSSPKDIERLREPKGAVEDDVDLRGWLEQDGEKTTAHFELIPRK